MKKLLFSISLVFSTCAFAQRAGDLDNSFDFDGKVNYILSTTFNEAKAVIIDKNNKILIGGSTHNGSNWDFALIRLNDDGSLDNTFGNGGKVSTDFNSGGDYANALLIQPDGKIILGGTCGISPNQKFAIARYNTNGILDSTFGINGLASTDFDTSNDEAFSLAIQSDGKIIAAGRTWQQSNNSFALARYKNDGSLDNSFGTNGKVITDITIYNDEIKSICMQPDGKIIVTGFSVYFKSGSSYVGDFVLARYSPNGKLDNTFGLNGIQISKFGSDYNLPYSIALQNDGKILVAGEALMSMNNGFALLRYNSNGFIDSTFATNGYSVKYFGKSKRDRAHAMIVQSDGKIILAGESYDSTNTIFGIVRYDTNGFADTSFGNLGYVSTSFISNNEDRAYAITIQNNDKVVVAGYSRPSSSGSSIIVSRYLLEKKLDINSPLINGISIYPNPTNTIINIQHSTHQKEELTIYNIIGEVVYKDTWLPSQTNYSIDVAAFAKGIYIIRVGNVVQKIVKE